MWEVFVHHGGRGDASGGGRAGRLPPTRLSSAAPNRGSHRDRHQPWGDKRPATFMGVKEGLGRETVRSSARVSGVGVKVAGAPTRGSNRSRHPLLHVQNVD